MVDFTGGTWRSLVDGAEISAIPDPDVYLDDDWGDNKLTDRDDSGTTIYNGVEGVYRPEWSIDDGSPSVDNDQLNIQDGDVITYEFADELPINTETVEWIAKGIDLSNNGGSGGDASSLAIFSETTDVVNEFRNFDRSYSFFFDGSNTFRFVEYSDGNFNVLSDGHSPSSPFDLRAKRDENGNWELWVGDIDGDADDTFSDETHTNAVYTGFIGRQDNDVDLKVDEIKYR